MHYCQHKISWLWAFHKVHHSAEGLTPLTANRHHPVDYALGAATAILLGAIGTVVFSRLHLGQLWSMAEYDICESGDASDTS